MQASEKEQQEIRDFYARGKGSIQDYARIYRLDVNEVLDIVNEPHLKTVHIGGDLIDDEELGPAGRGNRNYGEDVGVPYTTN